MENTSGETFLKNSKTVNVVSAVDLNDGEKKRSEIKARKIFGEFAGIEFKVEPEILGGLVFRCGEKILDLSVLEKLHRIEKLITG